MILRKTDYLPVAHRRRHTSKEIDVMFDEFLSSDAECMEVVGWDKEYKTVKSCQNSLAQCAMMRRLGVKASVRGDRVFLVKRGVKSEI